MNFSKIPDALVNNLSKGNATIIGEWASAIPFTWQIYDSTFQ